jgi:hypothetical protein
MGLREAPEHQRSARIATSFSLSLASPSAFVEIRVKEKEE